MERFNDDAGRAAVGKKPLRGASADRRRNGGSGQRPEASEGSRGGAGSRGAGLSPEDCIEALQAENARLREELEEREAMLARTSMDLARAERARQRFFAGASHELRTPLNAVICYGELLAGSVLGTLNGRQREAAERLRTAGRRLSDLVDALLELSHLQSGTVQPQVVMTDLEALAGNVVGWLQEDAEEREVRLLLEGTGKKVATETDPELAKRILLNLCVTALKLTSGRDVRVSLRKASGGACIDVSDDGPGIPAADRARAFKAFEFTSSPNQGVGLELAVAGEAASLLGARVTVSAQGGRGSIFTLHLPDRAAALAPG